jgi:hypothetical protein
VVGEFVVPRGSDAMYFGTCVGACPVGTNHVWKLRPCGSDASGCTDRWAKNSVASAWEALRMNPTRIDRDTTQPAATTARLTITTWRRKAIRILRGNPWGTRKAAYAGGCSMSAIR